MHIKLFRSPKSDGPFIGKNIGRNMVCWWFQVWIGRTHFVMGANLRQKWTVA
jgi:hypothetical protein